MIMMKKRLFQIIGHMILVVKIYYMGVVASQKHSESLYSVVNPIMSSSSVKKTVLIHYIINDLYSLLVF